MATPANAINESTTGICGFTGTAFTATPATNHAVLVGGATSSTLTNVGPTSTALQVLQSAGASADPVFSTATYPATTTSQQILYSSATNVVGQITTANSSLPATNSSGTMAMRALSVVHQVFTGDGTYTPTTGMLYCIVEMVGAGGGSGGCATCTGAQYTSSAGGGGGEYAIGVFSAATIGASKAITIGAGGIAGTAGANAGSTGGTTSIGAVLMSAIGGGGGAGGGASGTGTQAKGGIGGTGGTGGSMRATGNPGGAASSSFAGNFIVSGVGGASHFGGGAAANVSVSAATSGTTYGSGVSGGGNYNATQIAGAAGAAGFIIITEFVIN